MSLRYLLQRFGTLLLVLFGVSIVAFSIQPLIPGSPARVRLGVQATDENVATLERQMGLDRPLVVQYVDWVGGIVLRGDFGDSLITRTSISDEIARRLPATLALAGFALLIGLAIALPLGIASALRPGGKRDLAASVVSQVGVSVPDFWMGILLILLFAETLGWLPSSGYEPITEGVLPWLRHVILPAATAGLISGSIMTRFVRSALLEVLGMDYVRFPFLWPNKKVDASHENVIHDPNRCILCGRCVRASDEVDGKGLFAIKGRGIDSDITVDIDGKIGDTNISADDAAIQVCPTGSLCRRGLAYDTRYGERIYDQSPISYKPLPKNREVAKGSSESSRSKHEHSS